MNTTIEFTILFTERAINQANAAYQAITSVEGKEGCYDKKALLRFERTSYYLADTAWSELYSMLLRWFYLPGDTNPSRAMDAYATRSQGANILLANAREVFNQNHDTVMYHHAQGIAVIALTEAFTAWKEAFNQHASPFTKAFGIED